MTSITTLWGRDVLRRKGLMHRLEERAWRARRVRRTFLVAGARGACSARARPFHGLRRAGLLRWGSTPAPPDAAGLSHPSRHTLPSLVARVAVGARRPDPQLLPRPDLLSLRDLPSRRAGLLVRAHGRLGGSGGARRLGHVLAGARRVRLAAVLGSLRGRRSLHVRALPADQCVHTQRRSRGGRAGRAALGFLGAPPAGQGPSAPTVRAAGRVEPVPRSRSPTTSSSCWRPRCWRVTCL